MKVIAKDGKRTLAVADDWDGDWLALGVLIDPDQKQAFERQVGSVLARGIWEEATGEVEVRYPLVKFGDPVPAHLKLTDNPAPLTPAEKDLLLAEVVMGVAEKDSKVPFNAESRKLRKVYRSDVNAMKKKGYMPEVPKD
jgi:hypothetical protein